jgi:Transposase DDE domain
VAAGLAFPHAAQAIQIVRRRRPLNGKKWSTETVYAVTSLTATQASPAQLAAITRGHWLIENRLHWSATSPTTRTAPRSALSTGPASWPARPEPGHHHLAPDRGNQHRRGPAPPRAAAEQATAGNHELLRTTLPRPWVQALAWSPDSTRIAVGGDGTTVVVYPVAGGDPVARIRVSRTASVAFSPGGEAIGIADAEQVAMYRGDDGSAVWSATVLAGRRTGRAGDGGLPVTLTVRSVPGIAQGPYAPTH